MACTDGAGLAHCGDSEEARGIVGIGELDNPLATPEQPELQALRRRLADIASDIEAAHEDADCVHDALFDDDLTADDLRRLRIATDRAADWIFSAVEDVWDLIVHLDAEALRCARDKVRR